MNNCMETGTFATIWKTGTDMFNKCHGQTIEEINKERLEKELEEKNVIHQDQYDFRKDFSTLGTLNRVSDFTKWYYDGGHMRLSTGLSPLELTCNRSNYAHIIAYADGLALLIEAKNVRQLKMRAERISKN
ncbi:hypothetical protein ABEB36_006176 [Hypothenemus hampei]|uniref:Uncharacterized protein n=1 Tax=Hypothenemus hampei TaxID=57062 RepID=A0ABD1ESL3_HYPHA